MKKNGWIAVVGLVLLTGVLAVFWIGGIIMGNSASDTSGKNSPVDYVVVLGCRLEGEEPGRCLEERVKTAAKYLKKHPFAMAVCSGGQGDDEVISEAEAISRALQKKGIPARRILKEDQSHSTFENFSNTKKILDERKGGNPYQIAFVTNDFHVYRSRRLAAYVGFQNPVAVSAKTPAALFYPNLLREICSVVVSWIRFR